VTGSTRLSLAIRDTFAAALALPDHDGICRQAHGYRFTVDLTVAGDVSADHPWIVDVAALEALLKEQVLDPLDGSDLRDHMPYPSLEGLLLWILGRLRPAVPGLVRVEVHAPPKYRVQWTASGEV
jgi:6-pyruvoyl-tetrahydropterin synthase